MFNFPVDKYNIEIRQHPEYLGVETIASSTYAGKPVSGKAICNVVDEYDEEYGIQLATARCAAKVARKRLARAQRKEKEALEAYVAACDKLRDMRRYVTNAAEAFHKANQKVSDLRRGV